MPRYIHDCQDCTYLGKYEEYDLYYCNNTILPVYVVRFGNDGTNYVSMPPKYIALALDSRLGDLPDINALAVAVKRHKNRKIVRKPFNELELR